MKRVELIRLLTLKLRLLVHKSQGRLGRRSLEMKGGGAYTPSDSERTKGSIITITSHLYSVASAGAIYKSFFYFILFLGLFILFRLTVYIYTYITMYVTRFIRCQVAHVHIYTEV